MKISENRILLTKRGQTFLTPNPYEILGIIKESKKTTSPDEISLGRSAQKCPSNSPLSIQIIVNTGGECDFQ